jgi:hypothetical protein
MWKDKNDMKINVTVSITLDYRIFSRERNLVSIFICINMSLSIFGYKYILIDYLMVFV